MIATLYISFYWLHLYDRRDYLLMIIFFSRRHSVTVYLFIFLSYQFRVNVFEGLIGGFANCLEPMNFVLLFLGTFLGLLVGALPGLSSPMAIIILLPVTYF